MKQYRLFILTVVLMLAVGTSACAQKAKPATHSEMMSKLASLETMDVSSGHGRMQIVSIGQSAKGKDIPMVTISDPVIAPEDLKKLFIICRQHGDEPASTEAMLRLIDQLVLKDDEPTRDLLSKVAFYIVPMMNPDGADRNQRRNANGADLNRDWLNLWQPETRAVRAAIDSVAPDVIIDQHELSPTNTRSDFVETAGPKSGASPELAAESVRMQSLVAGMLRTHDIYVVSYEIDDRNPARLAHRYFPIHAGTQTILFETRQAGARQYQLEYRMQLHIVGTLTVAKYLAGKQDELRQRIAEHDARRWTVLASRGSRSAAPKPAPKPAPKAPAKKSPVSTKKR